MVKEKNITGVRKALAALPGLIRGRHDNNRPDGQTGLLMPGLCAAVGRCADDQLCTAAAPCLPGWMHQRRYYCPDLFYCSSAAVAYCVAFMSEIGRSILCRNVAARDSGE